MNIQKVTCLGSGTIGASWALCFAMHGYSVSLFDISEDSLTSARKYLDTNLTFLKRENILSEEAEKSIWEHISMTTDLTVALESSDFIQESVSESYEVKQALLNQIDALAPAHAIVATSTSGLRIDTICEGSSHRQRFLGAHPYNPPHLIPLVELSRGSETSDQSYESAIAFYKSLKKESVSLKKPVLGFIGNRLSFALYREFIHLISEGFCTLEDADKVVTYGIGLRWAIMGPAMLYDLGGGPQGIRGMSKLDYTLNAVFEDLSTLKSLPSDWYDIAEAGLIEEKEHFYDRTTQSPAEFRDQKLLSLLKLHDKL